MHIYFPSYGEAANQTGEEDPEAMLKVLRNYAPHALLGIKLGSKGAVFSLQPDDFVWVAPVDPPGPIVDTTGAGDCFYAGLIAGLCQGLEPLQAARVGAAAGACSVTGVGAVQGLRDFEATRQLAQR